MWEALATLSRNRPDPENNPFFFHAFWAHRSSVKLSPKLTRPSMYRSEYVTKPKLLIRTHVLNVRRQ
jgi:hypothetical protein